MTAEPDFDAVVIGAGLTGLYQAYRLREMGYRVLGVEAADDIGFLQAKNVVVSPTATPVEVDFMD